MYQRIVHQKRLYMTFVVLCLMLFQFVCAGRFTNIRAIQFLIVDLSLVSFVFAFHGFELDTLKNKNATIISSALGSFFGVLLGMFLVILFFGVQRDIYRRELIATAIAAIIGIPILSLLYYRIIFKHIPVTVCIGLGDPAVYKHLTDEITARSHRKVIVNAWVTTKDEALEVFKTIDSQSILVADLSLYRELLDQIRGLEKQKVQKFFITDATEYWLNRIPLQLLEEYRDHYEVLLNQTTVSQEKRIMDLALGVIMMVLSLPFILLFGLLIVLTSGFPIIFKQPRVGLYGQPFMFYKLRSLKNAKKAKISQDPNEDIAQRVTWVGKIMRKTRIDEFPQFFNILNGTMSVVGPRPEIPTLHAKWSDEIPVYDYRIMVRPGLTGWAQINYGHTVTKEETIRKVEYDLYYVKHKSLLFDIQIIMQTFETFLFMKGGK